VGAEQFSNLNDTLKCYAWNLIGQGSHFQIIQRAVLIFFFAYLFRNFFNVLQAFSISFIEQRVIKDLRDKLYSHMLSQSLSFFHKRKSGELASITLNDVTALNDKMMKAIRYVMREPFTIIIFLFLLFAISWKLTLTALIILPIAGILIDKFGKSLRRKSRRVQEALAEVTTLIYERLGGIRLIKISGTEAEEDELFHQKSLKFFKKAYRQKRFDILTLPTTELLGMAIISMILLYGSYLVFDVKSIDGEDFVRFIAILFSILAPAKGLGDAYTSIQIASASADRIFSIMDIHEELPEPSKSSAVDTFNNAIILDNVHFKYEGADVDALEGIDLQIKRDESVALVGPSGAGKTTLIGLIVRLYDPTLGVVRLDNKDIKTLNSVGLRKLFGVVSQDIVLFNDTVGNNIAYGCADISEEDIRSAAKLANADDFISAMPEGYNTVVGDRGVRLSGGQQQRLSIARALAHDPPIIIFDEATSQLDSESEMLIQQAMESLRENHTMIVIAHRLATVRKADRIIVLEQGRIIDQGNYNQLLERCELFARLCQQQFLT